MCKCSHTSSEHEKLCTLLEDEQEARKQLLQNIDILLGSNNQAYLGACQDVLIAVKDYISGVQILTDGMRIQLTLSPTEIHDTMPHRMNFDCEKAAPTQRCVAPK
jgi:hypothetical protein